MFAFPWYVNGTFICHESFKFSVIQVTENILEVILKIRKVVFNFNDRYF